MFTIDQLRALAREAETELSAEVHKFVDWIERKHAPAEITVAERERLAAEQRATTAQISTALAPQTAGGGPALNQSSDAVGQLAGEMDAAGVLSVQTGAAPVAAAAADGATAAGAPAAAGPAPDAVQSDAAAAPAQDTAAAAAQGDQQQNAAGSAPSA